MIPGSKGLNPHELAHKWVKDFGTRPRYEHKSGASASRYANIGENCGSTKYGTIRMASFNLNIFLFQNPLLKNRGYNMLKFILFLF